MAIKDFVHENELKTKVSWLQILYPERSASRRKVEGSSIRNNPTMIINIVQIIISVLLITTILLQQRGSGLSSAFGGSGGGGYYQKRGIEKILFRSSIALSAMFIAIAFLNLLQ